jgi:hypothetical protein
VLVLPVVLIGIVALVLRRHVVPGSSLRDLARVPAAERPLLALAGMTFIFLWAIGYYADRLTLTLAVLVICHLAVMLNAHPLRPGVRAALITLFLLLHAYSVFGTPIHFSERLLHS